MTLRDEQTKIRTAMNAAFSGLEDDPFLAQRILSETKGEIKMKRKLSTALVLAIAALMLSAIALATSALPGIVDFLSHGVGGWNVKEEAIVTPISQSHNSKLVNFNVTEAYWAEDGLSVIVQVSAIDKNQLVANSFEFRDSQPYNTYIEINNEWVHIDDWRDGKEVLFIELSTGTSGWGHYKRTEEGLTFICTASDVSHYPLDEGMTFYLNYWINNAQTGEKENGRISIELPPMTMQDGHV